MKKKSTFQAQFNTIETNNDDPTILKGTVIIHDFLKSWNNQVITEEVCTENMNTLIGKRIACKYISCEDNEGIDALTDHEPIITKDRDTGEEILTTNTIAIGFIDKVYIDDYTDEQGITKKVLYGEVTIWNDDKYSNIVSLLKEWLDKGIKIHMSIEYLYCNYNVIDGIEYIQSPIIYTSHVFLNSEQRGEYAEIEPAYSVAQLLSMNDKKSWNKALSQLINTQLKDSKNNKEESENLMSKNKFIKALNNISFGDIKGKIYNDLADKMTAKEYEYLWISQYDLFDDYFVYETYEEGKGWVNYKVPYKVTENDEVVVDLDSKQKASFKGEWVAISDYTQSQNNLKNTQDDLKKVNIEVTKLKEQLNSKDKTIKSLNSQIKSTNTEKTNLETQFNNVTDKIISLNSTLTKMKPIVDKYNQEQYVKSLNNMKTIYKEKFQGVNALDKFESKETQELIKKALNKDEEGKKAIESLNKMVVDSISIKEEGMGEKFLEEPCSKQENLIPIDSFEARYGL